MFTIKRLPICNEICCELNDSVNVIKEMIDVKDEFKLYQGFSSEEVEGFMVHWLTVLNNF